MTGVQTCALPICSRLDQGPQARPSDAPGSGAKTIYPRAQVATGLGRSQHVIAFEKAGDDFKERQVREARVEADSILAALEKARRDATYQELSGDERAAIDASVKDLLTVYNGGDHLAIREKIEKLNSATLRLAENMMNTAVRGALKGTKI